MYRPQSAPLFCGFIYCLFFTQSVLAKADFIEIGQSGCSSQYESYFSRYGKWTKGRNTLQAIATILSYPVGIGSFVITGGLRKKEKEYLESTGKVYALIQESVSDESTLSTDLFEKIKNTRTDLNSVQDLKNLIRIADEKQHLCTPINSGLVTLEELVQDLMVGGLSQESLKRPEYADIQNEAFRKDKNIPIYQFTKWSGTPFNSMALLQFSISQSAIYQSDLAEAETDKTASLIEKAVQDGHLIITEKMKLPVPGSIQSKQFWTKLFREENNKFIDALYTQHDHLKNKLRKYTKNKFNKEVNKDGVGSIKIAQERLSQGLPSIFVNYNWNYLTHDLFVVKDLLQVDTHLMKVTFYAGYRPELDMVRWLRTDSNLWFNTLDQARTNKDTNIGNYWYLDVDDFNR